MAPPANKEEINGSKIPLWQVLLLLFGIVASILGYNFVEHARMSERDQKIIETTATKQEVKEMKDDILKAIDKLEKKIDRQRR